MAYATVDDLEARWRQLDADEEERAGVLLDDASAMLDALVTVDATDEAQAALLRMVSCNMVSRAMLASGSDVMGLSQVDYGMGPFQQTAHFANPSGDMYLTAQERKLLGIGATYITSVQALVDGDWGSNA